MTRIWTLVLSLATNLLALAVPLSLLQVYDRILPNQSIGTAYVIFTTAALCVVLGAFLRAVRSALLARLGAEAEYGLWMRVVRGAFGLAEERKLSTADREILFSAPTRGQDALVGQSMLPIYDAPFGVIFLWLVWFLGGPLVLAPLAVVGIAMGLIAISALRHPKALRTELHGEGRVAALFAALARSGFGGLMRGQTAQRLRGLYEARTRMAVAQNRIDRMDGLLTDVSQSASLFVMLLLLGFGAGQVLAGDLTSGGLAACTLLGSRGALQVIGLAGALVRRQRAHVAFRELDRLPKTAPATATQAGTAPLGVALELDGAHEVLEAGAFVALDGGSAVGTGRALSHIADSLWKGRSSVGLTLDGKPVEFAAVEPRVRFLAAKPELIDGTLMENITRFDPALTDEAMALSKALGLDDAVSRLAHGYETLCGPTQYALTPGMATRAAMVQVLVGSPGLVLLQRPSIGLDIAGVQALAALLASKAGQVTIIAATERPELREAAQRIIRLSPEAALAEAEA